MTAKRCGTCEYFKEIGKHHTGIIFGQCDCPLPIALMSTPFNRDMNEDEGNVCPAHKPRTPKEDE